MQASQACFTSKFPWINLVHFFKLPIRYDGFGQVCDQWFICWSFRISWNNYPRARAKKHLIHETCLCFMKNKQALALWSSCELLKQIVIELDAPASVLLASLCNCMHALSKLIEHMDLSWWGFLYLFCICILLVGLSSWISVHQDVILQDCSKHCLFTFFPG